MKVYLLNGNDVTGSQFVQNSITYPANWCIYATTEELVEKGIVVLEIIWPELEAGEQYDGTYVDDIETSTRTYNKISSL